MQTPFFIVTFERAENLLAFYRISDYKEIISIIATTCFEAGGSIPWIVRVTWAENSSSYITKKETELFQNQTYCFTNNLMRIFSFKIMAIKTEEDRITNETSYEKQKTKRSTSRIILWMFMTLLKTTFI